MEKGIDSFMKCKVIGAHWMLICLGLAASVHLPTTALAQACVPQTTGSNEALSPCYLQGTDPIYSNLKRVIYGVRFPDGASKDAGNFGNGQCAVNTSCHESLG